VTAAPLPDLAAAIEALRGAWQESLLAAARARSEAGRRLTAAEEQARQRAGRFEPEPGLADRYARAWQLYGDGRPIGPSGAPPGIDEAERAWRATVGRCEDALLSFRQQRADDAVQGFRRHRPAAHGPAEQAARANVFSRKNPGPVLPGEFAADLAALRAISEALPALRDAEVAAAQADARDEIARAAERDQKAREAALSQATGVARNTVEEGRAMAGLAALGWDDFLAAVGDFDASGAAGWLRLGAYELAVPSGSLPEVPCLAEFPLRRGLVIEADPAHRAQALDLARSVILRALCSLPAGQLTLSFVDPVALGGSAADFLRLGDLAPGLVDRKPRTSTEEIEHKLAEVGAHLEAVIAQRREGQPYQLLVIFDLPAGLSASARARLASIIENGPACGVLPLVLGAGPDWPGPRSALDVVTWTHEGRIRLESGGGPAGPDVLPDRCPPITFAAGRPASPAATILAVIGESARAVDGGLAGHAFISYVREDGAAVDLLQGALEAAGVPVWRDTARLWPGEDWRAKIRSAITTDALVFICCFSRASVARNKTYQNEELMLAIEQLRQRSPGRPWLIPVRLDDCEVPDPFVGGGRTLSSIQYCDVFGDSSAAGLRRLTDAVLRILRPQG
jgi:hypothetical protein